MTRAAQKCWCADVPAVAPKSLLLVAAALDEMLGAVSYPDGIRRWPCPGCGAGLGDSGYAPLELHGAHLRCYASNCSIELVSARLLAARKAAA